MIIIYVLPVAASWLSSRPVQKNALFFPTRLEFIQRNVVRSFSEPRRHGLSLFIRESAKTSEIAFHIIRVFFPSESSTAQT